MLPRKRNMKLLLITVLSLVKISHQFGSGGPPLGCLDQTPRHSDIEAQTSVPPYTITIHSRFTSASQVKQGDELNVTISSPYVVPSPIGGFILQARAVQDTERIVGKFTKVPSPELAQITSCRGDNDTVTHTNPEEKHPLSFTWRAPDDFLGGILFRATVAQSYATFWKNVESPLVEVVTPDTDVITTMPTDTQQRTTQGPPVIMESKPKHTPAPLDIIYQGCADTKLCFGVPQNCIPARNCKAIVAIFVAGDTYTFEIQGTDNPKYVAAGLSLDNKMGSDSAMECVRNDNGKINLFTSWTYPKAEPYARRADSPQDIVQLLESSIIDGTLYCKFRRDSISTVRGETFDLANNKYHLMVVAGDSIKDTGRVGLHNLAYEATGSALSLTAVGSAAGYSRLLVKLHCSCMIAAWLGSASLGVIFARYFKTTWVGKTLGGQDVWFSYHRMLMALTWVLTATGFVLIVAEVGGWQDTGDNPHAITGIVTILLCFIQPFGAFFRPQPDSKLRPLFNWMHWVVGNSAHILGITSIFLAVYLQKTQLPAWSVFVLAAFVVFYVLAHVAFSLTACVSDGLISNGQVNSFPLKDTEQPQQDSAVDNSSKAPFSGFRKHLLGVYSHIILLFVVAMICFGALFPIVEV